MTVVTSGFKIKIRKDFSIIIMFPLIAESLDLGDKIVKKRRKEKPLWQIKSKNGSNPLPLPFTISFCSVPGLSGQGTCWGQRDITKYV